MRRRILIGMVTAVLVTGLAAPAAADDHTWRWDECRFQGKDGRTGWTVEESRLTIRCVADVFGVSVTTALAIAYRESHFHATAVNDWSGACGLFQHIPRYFPGRLRSAAEARPAHREFAGRCLNARSNTYAALWLAKRYGWEAWSTY